MHFAIPVSSWVSEYSIWMIQTSMLKSLKSSCWDSGHNSRTNNGRFKWFLSERVNPKCRTTHALGLLQLIFEKQDPVLSRVSQTRLVHWMDDRSSRHTCVGIWQECQTICGLQRMVWRCKDTAIALYGTRLLLCKPLPQLAWHQNSQNVSKKLTLLLTNHR